MDLARTKNILILIFVLLNIFLGAVLVKELRVMGITSETLQNARLALKGRGVIVDCEIPDYDGSVGTLVYKKAGFDSKKLIQSIFEDEYGTDDPNGDDKIRIGNRQLNILDGYSFTYKASIQDSYISDLGTPGSIMDYLKNIFWDLDIPLIDYHIDTVVENADEKLYIYKQRYKGFWVFENYIAVKISSKEIDITCRHRAIDNISNDKKIMPVHQVLLKNSKVIRNIVVTKIKLGFKGYSPDGGSRETNGIPVWCIEIRGTQNGIVKYFNAYDGEEIHLDANFADFDKNSEYTLCK